MEPFAVVVADSTGTIQAWNAEAERLFGYPAGEVIGRTLDVIVPEAYQDQHWSGFRGVMSSDDVEFDHGAVRVPVRHRDGSVGGVFITRADIEKRQAHRLSEVLATVPGVQILRSRGAGQDGIRMARAAGGRDCPVTIWVDGQRVPGLNVDDIGPSEVEAVEIYKGAASLPAEYNVNRGTPACGTIAIWTRVPGT